MSAYFPAEEAYARAAVYFGNGFDRMAARAQLHGQGDAVGVIGIVEDFRVGDVKVHRGSFQNPTKSSVPGCSTKTISGVRIPAWRTGSTKASPSVEWAISFPL